MLTGLNLILKRAMEKCSLSELAEAESLVANLLKGVRGLSMDLRPHVLDNLGLAVALRWHVKKFVELTKIRVSLSLRAVPRHLPEDVATGAFRVVQEALTNAARHSDARRVVVSVTGRARAIHIQLLDNGRGFNPEKHSHGGSGLASLRERVRLTGGELLIQSQPGSGTCIRVTMPVS